MRAKEEVVVAVILAACGVAYFAAAIDYPIGRMDSPGAGLMPRALGVVFVVLSLLLAGESLLALKTGGRVAGKEGGSELKAPAGVTAILVAYLVALPYLGFMIATVLAVGSAGRLLGLTGWAKPLALAAGTTAVAMLVFGYLLDVPLPSCVLFGG